MNSLPPQYSYTGSQEAPRVDFAFRCPRCSGAVGPRTGLCDTCHKSYLDANGVPNFVRREEVTHERKYYDQHYRALAEGRQTAAARKRSVDEALQLWRNPWFPHDGIVWEKLRPMDHKSVLLIGNGESEKEIAFLTLNPAILIYSDLSSAAVKHTLSRFDLSRYGVVQPAAIDAMDLPFPDGAIDIIYGYAMVHHLPDIRSFLGEAYRVLRPGGRCVFFDDAFAPAWHASKQTILRPLMTYSHRKSGISPEDYRFSMSGGFREAELATLARSLGGEFWCCKRSLLGYIWHRGALKVAPSVFPILAPERLGRWLSLLDQQLSRFTLVRKNLIRLVWGFDKPA